MRVNFNLFILISLGLFEELPGGIENIGPAMG